jgi:hypothetical protein
LSSALARMTPRDQERFAAMITDFVDGCNFEKT